MTIRTFEQAFNAVFHNKENFQDFCLFNPTSEIEEISLKKRKIYSASEKLKKFLRFIDKVVLRNTAKNSEVVHSYIKGKSVLTAAQAHINSKFFFLTDIKSFFPNINENDVTRVLNRDKSLIPISDFENYISVVTKLTTNNNTLPIGFPTSPQLSNGLLFEFDNALESFCQSRSLIYTRYSDDIIISSKEKSQLIDLKDIVQQKLHEFASKELFLNEEKTYITHIGNKVKILGLVITTDGRITVDAKYKKSLETILHFYSTDKSRYEDYLEREFEGKERSIFGLFHYVKSTDPTYLSKLQKKYGVLALRSLMEDKWSDNRQNNNKKR